MEKMILQQERFHADLSDSLSFCKLSCKSICKPRSDCLFSQSEGQLLILHVLSQQSIYGMLEAESGRDRE